ncbi:MAG: hypothetical protein OEO79_19245 [Gemmatimonadota bacterium]|nr:hypothetical protein [Gemmatimonadota bacterium]
MTHSSMNTGDPHPPAELDVPEIPCALPGELWGLVSLFNPAGYRNKLQNLRIFSERARSQGIKLLIVELAFGDADHEVPEELAEIVLRLRTTSVLWQKERLLNVGVSSLPAECDKVAWLDADIIFENDDWVRETSRLLETYCVVQPFDTACWLRQGEMSAPPEGYREQGNSEGQWHHGMAYAMSRVSDPKAALLDYHVHGHVGFAWAIRREIIEKHGLYDAQVLGNGDFVVAHAMYGDEDFWDGRNWQCRRLSEPMLAHMERWGRPFFDDVQGSVMYVPGRVLHMWHGNQSNRQYRGRLTILKETNFDPDRDLVKEPSGCWAWATDRPALHEWASSYFHRRREE